MAVSGPALCRFASHLSARRMKPQSSNTESVATPRRTHANAGDGPVPRACGRVGMEVHPRRQRATSRRSVDSDDAGPHLRAPAHRRRPRRLLVDRGRSRPAGLSPGRPARPRRRAGGDAPDRDRARRRRLAAGRARDVAFPAIVVARRRWRCCAWCRRSRASSTSCWRSVADAPAVGRGGLPVAARARSRRACSPVSGSPGACTGRRRSAAGGCWRGSAIALVAHGRGGDRCSPRSRSPTTWPSATAGRTPRGSDRPRATCSRRRATRADGRPERAPVAPPVRDASTSGRSARSTSPACASGDDFRWLAYVALDPPAGPVRRRRGSATTRGPDARDPAGAQRPPATVADDTVDVQALASALSPATARPPRTTASRSSRAPAPATAGSRSTGRRSATAFPQVAWLVGDDDLHRWRGQLDYWVFLDGQLGQVAGSVNGEAARIVAGRPPRAPSRST